MHGRRVEKESNSALSDFPDHLLDCSMVRKLISTIDSAHVCCGYPNPCRLR